MRLSRTLLAVVLPLLLIVLSGCGEKKTLFERRETNLTSDRNLLKKSQPAPKPRFTLEELLQYALLYNLDVAVARQEEAIRNEAEIESHRKMLPSLMLDLDRSRRSNVDASKSSTLFGRDKSKEPSFSEPKGSLTMDAALTWRLVDFGIAYFKSRQAHNQSIIASEQQRRNIHQLVLDLTQAYWQVQVAARALASSAALMSELEARRSKISSQVESRDVSRIEGAETLAELMETELRIDSYRKQWQSSMINLEKLAGFPAGTSLQLVDESFAPLTPSLPIDLPRAEEEALKNRPELFEMDAEEAIAADEVRVALASLWPNASLFARLDRDKNPFLYEHNWYTVGIKSSLDLLAIPGKVSRKRITQKMQTQVVNRRLALAMAVVSQVHLASIELSDSERRYTMVADIHKQRQLLVSEYRKQVEEGQAVEKQSFTALTKAFFAEMQYCTAHSEVMVAKARMSRTLGHNPEGASSVSYRPTAVVLPALPAPVTPTVPATPATPNAQAAPVTPTAPDAQVEVVPVKVRSASVLLEPAPVKKP